ncbi:MAG: sulfatase-like hydrolase/transferase [Succinivibrionaceae bacterium]|nr:sulfatase-like hydrolase/transferase [Succinivibrionaceae bacterium]
MVSRIHSAAISLSSCHQLHTIKAFLQTGTGKAAAVALLVFLSLAMLPFHSVDLWLENLFYTPGRGFIWKGIPFIEKIHSSGKIITAFVLFWCIFLTIRGFRSKNSEFRAAAPKALWTIIAIALSLIANGTVRAMSGVACPWDTVYFGGTEPLSTPAGNLLSLTSHGKCWPSCFAGTAYSLFAVYFALRERKPRAAQIALITVAILGTFFGIAQMGRGAHFFSHVIAAGTLDFAICAFLTPVMPLLQKINWYPKAKTVKDADSTPAVAFASNAAIQKGTAGRAALWCVVITAWWTAVASLPFWQESLTGIGTATAVRFAFACGICLLGAYAALMMILTALLPGVLARWSLALFSIIAAGGFAFSELYHAAMTPDMLRNALETDSGEAMGLMSPRLLVYFLICALPPVWLSLRLVPKALSIRSRAGLLLWALTALIAGCAALMTDYSSVAIYMRNNHEARYFIALQNIISSFVRTVTSDGSASAVKERKVIDPSPKLLPARTSGRPVVVITVVGETARASSWGLDGYPRDTTPRLLAEKDLVNFSDVTSCGTSTAVSVPCIFSEVGHSNYDRDRILSEEQLPSLMQRAGVSSFWIDNQSGSKGAATGIKEVSARDLLPKDLAAGLTGDEALPPALRTALKDVKGPTAIYLHMMGSHGPEYAKRYPEAFAKWGPVCTRSDLRSCSLGELRNAYDNSILFTDSVLADMIEELKSHSEFDSALIYFSYHGESLGESGFFLHGAPYALAPDDQTHVPLVMWFSDGFRERTGLDISCLKSRAGRSASHDNVFATLLQLSGVQSRLYDRSLDLIGGCEHSPSETVR